MYLHLGDNRLIAAQSVIGFFDLETATVGKATRALTVRLQKAGRVVEIGSELPRSLVLCGSGEDITLYVSPITTATLIKRGWGGLSESGALKRQKRRPQRL